jgi:hypothetical protein
MERSKVILGGVKESDAPHTRRHQSPTTCENVLKQSSYIVMTENARTYRFWRSSSMYGAKRECVRN